nr:MAG TPA: hypothetical protein [Caudoviricetes sp.]
MHKDIKYFINNKINKFRNKKRLLPNCKESFLFYIET